MRLAISALRARVAAARRCSSYARDYRRSIEEPREFWRPIADEIDWHRAPTEVLDDTVRHHPKW